MIRVGGHVRLAIPVLDRRAVLEHDLDRGKRSTDDTITGVVSELDATGAARLREGVTLDEGEAKGDATKALYLVREGTSSRDSCLHAAADDGTDFLGEEKVEERAVPP